MSQTETSARRSPGVLRGYISSLDGLRGFSLLMVVFAHSTWGLVYPLHTTGDVLLAKLSGHVWVAMDFFFVLSGFLITGILADARGKTGYFKNYFARRALRVFPLYYGFIILAFVILPLVGVMIPDQQAMGERWKYFLYVQNVAFAQRGLIPRNTGYLWSMAVEEQYYLLWPIAVLLVPSRTLQRWCLVTVPALIVARLALVAMGGTFVLLYVTTPLRVDSLLLGSFLALYAREPGGAERLVRWSRPTFLLSALAGLVIIAYKPLLGVLLHGSAFAVNSNNLALDHYVQALRFSVQAIFAAALLVRVAVAPPGSWVKRFFDNRPMRLCGKYSYATYMFHVPVFVLCEYFGFRASQLPLVHGAQWPRALAGYGILLGVSLVLAAISWEVYEKQFLKLKVYFQYRERDAAPRRASAGEPAPVLAEPDAAPQVFTSP